MAVAEDWRGRPLIDEGGAWWLVPASIAVAGFFVGGVVAARGRRTAGGAAAAGLAVAAVATAVLVAADGLRRLLLNPTLPVGVVYLWMDAAAVAFVVTMVGTLSTALLSARRPPVRTDADGPGRRTADPAGADGDRRG
jgi:uncharacterized membrane protein (UPF0136 family)